MFKLIWSALLGGNPTSWAVLGLSALLALGSSFGAGFYSASHMQAAANAVAAPKIAAAQEKHDVQEHAIAGGVSLVVHTADIKFNNKLEVILPQISDPDAPATCDMNPGDADALNAAGTYQ